MMQRNYDAGRVVPIRNPWMDSSSSSASRASCRRHRDHPRPHVVRPIQHVGPPPASEWLRPQPGPILNQPPQHKTASIGSTPTESAVGHGGSVSSTCAKCDSFCYHCLQVVYIAGILTGISLVIAGSVLRGSPRRGDLLVLVYIGVLLAAVCTLLLSVHYCVRRGVKERKRATRTPRLVVQSGLEGTELQQLAHPRPATHPHDFTDVRIHGHGDPDEIRPYPVESRQNLNEFRGYPNDAPTFATGRSYPTEFRPHSSECSHGRNYPSDFRAVTEEAGNIRGYPSEFRLPSDESARNYPGEFRAPSDDSGNVHRGYPTEFRVPPEEPAHLRSYPGHDVGDIRRSGRSRSSHSSSHGRRYYLHDERPEEWERQPYQPLLHRPPR